MTHQSCIIVFLAILFQSNSQAGVRAGGKFSTRPYFGDAETEITVQQGEAAFFNCHVFNLANQTVSWMRNSDGYPLFIGHEKYINDQRFELVSIRRGQNTLKLKFSNASDAGKFECQVSTSPKISQVFKLRVVVPSVSVEGEQEKHVMAGSPVKLKCFIKNCLKQPSYVFWYRSDYRLVDSGERVRVVTRMSSSGDTGTALSILNIDQVHLTDKGNYTCKPASGGQASISLHVLEGETRAELHIDQANVGQSVLKKETQYIKLFKSLFVIFAINYKLLEKHQV